MKPKLLKIILPPGYKLGEKEKEMLQRFELAEDFHIKQAKNRKEFLESLGRCIKCGNSFNEDGFYLDVFGQKYCPRCYEEMAKRPN